MLPFDFAPVINLDPEPTRLIPETKGRSLEEMDVIFGAVQADKRRADIAAQARGMSLLSLLLPLKMSECARILTHPMVRFAALGNEVSSERSVDQKV